MTEGVGRAEKEGSPARTAGGGSLQKEEEIIGMERALPGDSDGRPNGWW